MLFKTRGIVLSYVKYRETSIIVKIYTEQFGIQSYIVNSVRSKNSKPKIALYQPLTLLDLVVYHKDTIAIHRISELKTEVPLLTIPFDFKKSCIGIFLTEVLVKTLNEEISNPDFFNFLFNSILTLDNLSSNFENFHLQFLLALTNYLGFAPSSAQELIGEINHTNIPDEVLVQKIEELIQSSYTTVLQLSNIERRRILEILLRFYQLNVEGFHELKSVEVLKDLMS